MQKHESNEYKSTHDDSAKLLSFCIPGKNDNYMGDFRYRITTTINHLACNIKKLNLSNEIEILIADWGSSVPLSQALSLNKEAIEVCRFIYVPPSVVETVEGDKNKYHTAKAYNVSIRRAKGSYIIYHAADTLLTIHSLEQLARFAKGEIETSINPESCYALIPRIDVPWQFVARKPTIPEWDRYLMLMSKTQTLEPVEWYSLCAGIGAIMAHREIWRTLRGIDESLSGWGWIDIDLGMRASQQFPQVSLSTLGIITYHMEHYPSSARQKSSPRVFYPNNYVNDKNWGLSQFELAEIDSAGLVDFCNLQNQVDSGEEVSENFSGISKVSVLEQLYESRICSKVLEICSNKKSLWSDIRVSKLRPLFFLSWYSLERLPRRYLEISTKSIAYELIGGNCPSVEIYKVGCWGGEVVKNSPLEIVSALSDVDFRGYLRLINGDVRTSVQRLRQSFIGKFEFDLIFLEQSEGIDFGDSQISELVRWLSLGGGLVLSLKSPGDLDRIWDNIKEIDDKFTLYRCKDRKIGMVLREGSMGLGTSEQTVAFTEKFLGMWFIKLMAINFFRKVCFVLRSPSNVMNIRLFFK